MKRIFLLLALAALTVVGMAVSGGAVSAAELIESGGGAFPGDSSGQGFGFATLEFPSDDGGTTQMTVGGGGGGGDFSDGTDLSPGENSGGGGSGHNQTTDTSTDEGTFSGGVGGGGTGPFGPVDSVDPGGFGGRRSI